MSQWMIDVGPGCFCQPVRWLECLMFSLLLALLCIFLCQCRWAIRTARALQRPAGHPSSSDALNVQPQLRTSDLLWLESQLTDRSPIKKHAPISLLSCTESIAAPVMVGGNCHRRLETDSCVILLICLEDDLSILFIFFLALFFLVCGFLAQVLRILTNLLWNALQERKLELDWEDPFS